MRLTPDLINGARQLINPATRDRELDLREYKIPVIENLGATLDQYDCIDLSDNEIKKLDGFPQLTRIKKILLSNNKISKIDVHLSDSLPNLEWLILTNNNISNLSDIDPLASCAKLECLCLLNNPITTKQHYRLYLINKIPHLRILDFRKVKLIERQEAAKLFKGKKGKALEQEIAGVSEFVPGEDPNGESSSAAPKGRTPEEIEAIKLAISKATTLEEVERLNQMLKSGFIPGQHNFQAGGGGDAEQDAETNVEEASR